MESCSLRLYVDTHYGVDNANTFDASKTNHIERLDPALLRPGRIDKKVPYKMATKKQAWALYRRFFPEARFADIMANAECSGIIAQDCGLPRNEKRPHLSELASQFAESVPEDEFSTAELQGYLLTCKMKPLDAVSGISEWIQHERTEKREREEREKQRKEKLRESKLKAKTAIMADLIGPLQQQKTAAPEDAVADSSLQSNPLSDTDNDLVTPPRTMECVASQLGRDWCPSSSLNANALLSFAFYSCGAVTIISCNLVNLQAGLWPLLEVYNLSYIGYFQFFNLYVYKWTFVFCCIEEPFYNWGRIATSPPKTQRSPSLF